MTAELRRRLGKSFTLAELAAALAHGRIAGRARRSRSAARVPDWLASAADAPSICTHGARGTTPSLLGHDARERRRVARRRQRRVLPWRPLILALALVCVFAVGVALGEALHDNPKGAEDEPAAAPPAAIAPARSIRVTCTPDDRLGVIGLDHRLERWVVERRVSWLDQVFVWLSNMGELAGCSWSMASSAGVAASAAAGVPAHARRGSRRRACERQKNGSMDRERPHLPHPLVKLPTTRRSRRVTPRRRSPAP